MTKISYMSALKQALVVTIVGEVLFLWLLGGVLAGLFGVSATVLTAWVSIAGGVVLFLSAFVGLIVAEAIHFE